MVLETCALLHSLLLCLVTAEDPAASLLAHTVLPLSFLFLSFLGGPG